MARDRYVSYCTFYLCLCLFLFFDISCAVPDNDYYDYHTSQPCQRLKFAELRNLRRRAVTDPSLETILQQFNKSDSTNSVKPSKDKTVVANKSPDSTNLITKTIHNLGVNGTGQRKNMTLLTQQPLSVHSPANSSVSTLKNISLNGDTSLPPVLPDILTPEDPSTIEEFDDSDLGSKNITEVKTDTHIYYNSTIYNDEEIGKSFWVDLTNRSDVKVSDLLSSSHRRAATIKLSFEFPFYGLYIKNVTVATGGFIYTGNYVHTWLAATQYIAPLMANFHTGLSNDSHIKFVDNGTTFTVEWDRVLLHDKPKEGKFTFQATLHKNGDIVFVYKNVPLLIKDINDDHHPVKVGLSDAYILDKTIFFVRRKTIYEYHRVDFKKEEIRNWTAIYLKALPTCLDLHNCSSCVSTDINLECEWCPSMNQCSTGQDRNRQDWIDKGCEAKNISHEMQCNNIYEEKVVYLNKSLSYALDSYDSDYIGKIPPSSLGPSGYIAVIFLIIMVCGFSFWTTYAYRNPHTTSGQMLIRYRPSQWRWRRGEARYTAATIHM